jgi:hypothetical protein
MYTSHEKNAAEKENVQEGNKSLETVRKPNIRSLIKSIEITNVKELG